MLNFFSWKICNHFEDVLKSVAASLNLRNRPCEFMPPQWATYNFQINSVFLLTPTVIKNNVHAKYLV